VSGERSLSVTSFADLYEDQWGAALVLINCDSCGVDFACPHWIVARFLGPRARTLRGDPKWANLEDWPGRASFAMHAYHLPLIFVVLNAQHFLAHQPQPVLTKPLELVRLLQAVAELGPPPRVHGQPSAPQHGLMVKSIAIAADASRLASLRFSYIPAVCAFVAPRLPGASTAIIDRLDRSRALRAAPMPATR
jgi:hypothetical protein